jgi:hypothetical protein
MKVNAGQVGFGLMGFFLLSTFIDYKHSLSMAFMLLMGFPLAGIVGVFISEMDYSIRPTILHKIWGWLME